MTKDTNAPAGGTPTEREGAGSAADAEQIAGDFWDVDITMDVLGPDRIALTFTGHPTGVESLMSERTRDLITEHLQKRVAELRADT